MPRPEASVLSRAESRSFSAFLLARGASSLSFQMLSVALGWQVYRLTGSAFDLGLVGLAQFAPMVCLTLVVGHLADRFDRRRIVAVCLVIEGLATALLAAAVIGNWLNKELVYLLIVIGAAARAFEAPTMATLIPSLVTRAALPRATAWATSSNQTAMVLGPALGGLAYAVSPGAAFGLSAALFMVGAVLIARLALARRVPSREPVTLASIFSGIHFIRRKPVILGTISLDLFAVLLGGATALLPIYAKDILHTGPWGLGVLRAAPALGALSMSMYLGRRTLSGPVGMILFGALIVFGAATVGFALSHWLPLSLLALLVLGAADAVSVLVRITVVQLQTPDAMLGRVSAVSTLFVGASNQLGEFESGATAALLGTVPAVIIGGLGTIAVSLLWMRLFPSLRRMRSLDGEDREEATPPALRQPR